MEENGDEVCRKRMRCTHNTEDLKKEIISTKEPIVIKNILCWTMLKWSSPEWIEHLGNPILDVRMGTAQCTKVPQWEGNCEIVSMPLKEVLDETNNRMNGTWMYFDYKHMKQYFKNKPDILESISWADFGFPDKTGKDSTIWIGTEGAYTPCHMDTYGCNIVAQVYGRKRWVMFPPNTTSVLKPTRVPYEESSVYSNIHFGCGLNVPDNVGAARVVELCPGDVLVVPRHWWHYVHNLTTAISINMWIPKESDHSSRLEESLVRYFLGMTLKNLDAATVAPLLNPNEMDLLEEPTDLRQICWCMDQVLLHCHGEESENHPSCDTSVSVVGSVTAAELRRLLLVQCGCVEDKDFTEPPRQVKLTEEHVINAFCHPDVIAKVAEILISLRKS